MEESARAPADQDQRQSQLHAVLERLETRERELHRLSTEDYERRLSGMSDIVPESPSGSPIDSPAYRAQAVEIARSKTRHPSGSTEAPDNEPYPVQSSGEALKHTADASQPSQTGIAVWQEPVGTSAKTTTLISEQGPSRLRSQSSSHGHSPHPHERKVDHEHQSGHSNSPHGRKGHHEHRHGHSHSPHGHKGHHESRHGHSHSPHERDGHLHRLHRRASSSSRSRLSSPHHHRSHSPGHQHHDSRVHSHHSHGHHHRHHHGHGSNDEILTLQTELSRQRVLNEELASTLSEVLKRVAAADTNGQQQTEELRQAYLSLSILEAQNTALTQQQQAALESQAQLEARCAELTGKLDEGNKMQQAHATHIEEMLQTVRELEAQVRDGEEALAAERRARDAAEERVRTVQDAAAEDLLQLRGRQVTVESEMSHWQSVVEQGKAEAQALRRELDKVRSELQDAKERAAYAEGAAKETQRRAQLLQDKVTNQSSELVTAQQERDRLQTILDHSHAAAGSSGLLNSTTPRGGGGSVSVQSVSQSMYAPGALGLRLPTGVPGARTPSAVAPPAAGLSGSTSVSRSDRATPRYSAAAEGPEPGGSLRYSSYQSASRVGSAAPTPAVWGGITDSRQALWESTTQTLWGSERESAVRLQAELAGKLNSREPAESIGGNGGAAWPNRNDAAHDNAIRNSLHSLHLQATPAETLDLQSRGDLEGYKAGGGNSPRNVPQKTVQQRGSVVASNGLRPYPVGHAKELFSQDAVEIDHSYDANREYTDTHTPATRTRYSEYGAYGSHEDGERGHGDSKVTMPGKDSGMTVEQFLGLLHFKSLIPHVISEEEARAAFHSATDHQALSPNTPALTDSLSFERFKELIREITSGEQFTDMEDTYQQQRHS